MLSVLCDGCAGAVSVLYLLFVILSYWLLPLLLFIIITHREITISTGVLVIDLAAIHKIQPLTVPDHFNKGRYLRLKVGAMDRGERGDHNALGLRFIRWLEGKICTIYCFWYGYKGGALWETHNNIIYYWFECSALRFIWTGHPTWLIIYYKVILNSTISQGT